MVFKATDLAILDLDGYRVWYEETHRPYVFMFHERVVEIVESPYTTKDGTYGCEVKGIRQDNGVRCACVPIQFLKEIV